MTYIEHVEFAAEAHIKMLNEKEDWSGAEEHRSLNNLKEALRILEFEKPDGEVTERIRTFFKEHNIIC